MPSSLKHCKQVLLTGMITRNKICGDTKKADASEHSIISETSRIKYA